MEPKSSRPAIPAEALPPLAAWLEHLRQRQRDKEQAQKRSSVEGHTAPAEQETEPSLVYHGRQGLSQGANDETRTRRAGQGGGSGVG
jgi:hypothetical protein